MKPGTMVGRHVLLSRLAVGGMAEIYLAKQLGPRGFERICAVKLIREVFASSDEHLTMFLDEARIAAQLCHPGIPQIYEFGESGGNFYLSMEYLAGASLSDLIDAARRAGKRLPIAPALKIASLASAALEYAHKRTDPHGRPLKIVHRDVSPDNIFVTFDGDVKLLDFGIAKAADRHAHTAAGFVKGKLPYMSPEQAEGTGSDARTDVFSMGVTIYEVLTGAHPFGSDPDQIVIGLAGQRPFPRPSESVRDVPAYLDQVVLRATALKRDQRMSSAGELHVRLEEWLRSVAPVTAYELATLIDTVMPGHRTSKRKVVVGALEEKPEVTDYAMKRVDAEPQELPPSPKVVEPPRATGRATTGETAIERPLHGSLAEPDAPTTPLRVPPPAKPSNVSRLERTVIDVGGGFSAPPKPVRPEATTALDVRVDDEEPSTGKSAAIWLFVVALAAAAIVFALVHHT